MTTPARILAVLALLAPAPALAEGGDMVAVAGRTFLVGWAPRVVPGQPTPGSALMPGAGDLPLAYVGWIDRVIAADPVLAGAEVVLTAASADAAPMMRCACIAGPGLRTAGDVPKARRVDGLAVEAEATRPGLAPSRLVYRPEGASPGFFVHCDPEGGDLGAARGRCTLYATYPPDARLVLVASSDGPLPGAEGAVPPEAVAARLRELAECLDVTGRIPADPAARLAALRAANPRLVRCTEVPTS